MPGQERTTLTPPQESRGWGMAAGVVILVLVAAGAWWWWQNRMPPVAVSAAPPTATPAAAPASTPASTPASGPQNLIDALASPDAALPALAAADNYVAQAITELLGQRQVASFLQIDGLVRRAVATVDNLARAHAPAGIWPVQPAPGRFTVQGEAESQQIAPDNAARYSAVVQWVESVDLQRAVALYARLYPLFQQAYEELGYPGRYFNDRVVAVIDHLLAAPEPAAPVRVQLTEVKGEWSSARPWVRYEFADPQLQALSSGQKIMVRVGLVNERRLKARLKALRALVATGVVAKAKP